MQFLIDLPPETKLLLVSIFTFILRRIIKIQATWIVRILKNIEVFVFEDVPFRQRIFFYFPTMTVWLVNVSAGFFGPDIFYLPQDLIAVVVLGLGIVYNNYIAMSGGDLK